MNAISTDTLSDQRDGPAYMKLQNHCRHNGSDLVFAATPEAEVCALERRYDVKLPGEFRMYLLQSCPVGEKLDRDLGCWWPLSRIKNITEELRDETPHDKLVRNAENYLLFADWGVWMGAWAIACGDDENRGRVFYIDGANDRFVADSFSLFIDHYISDDRDVI